MTILTYIGPVLDLYRTYIGPISDIYWTDIGPLLESHHIFETFFKHYHNKVALATLLRYSFP